jgi:hypothetical protein
MPSAYAAAITRALLFRYTKANMAPGNAGETFDVYRALEELQKGVGTHERGD